MAQQNKNIWYQLVKFNYSSTANSVSCNRDKINSTKQPKWCKDFMLLYRSNKLILVRKKKPNSILSTLAESGNLKMSKKKLFICSLQKTFPVLCQGVHPWNHQTAAIWTARRIWRIPSVPLTLQTTVPALMFVALLVGSATSPGWEPPEFQLAK